MKDYVDLEIALRRDGDGYAVELRCSQPASDAQVRSCLSSVRIDIAKLLESADDAAYGQHLMESLLPAHSAEGERAAQAGGQSPRDFFVGARSIAQSQGMPLRLRLFIGPNASELQSLHWEKLTDPQDGSRLLTGQKVFFSRYLSSLDWSPVRLRRRTDLRALVVIANPDLNGWGLAQLDVADELELAKEGLGDIRVTYLASRGTATLKIIEDRLREEQYDILYLVCHGILREGEQRLWLEDEAGQVDLVSGNELVARLKGLPVRPRLVVLASCQSAGRGQISAVSGEAMAAIGPRLAEACIPAVLAMQGSISMETAAGFMRAFFRELGREDDGEIDRAVAVARDAVKDGPDWWMPALFMRLESGRIWYTPGFSRFQQEEITIWDALLSGIRHKYCTPILGPGLTDSLFGSRREIAQRWAESYQFPMAPHDRGDLSQVAQYLAVHVKYRTLWHKLEDQLCQAVLKRHREDLRTRFGDDLPQRLHELTSAMASLCQARECWDLYQTLAQLRLPIYVSAEPTNLLEQALAALPDTQPQRKLCPWNKHIVRIQQDDDEPKHPPSPEHPLVYYLFGRLEEPRSLVLTEDDYYDFLIGVTNNRELIPPAVRRALATDSLLFLGFRLEESGFRVLLRSIMSQEVRSRQDLRDEISNVAAQVYPEEGIIQSPERARRYLERYFQRAAIDIYWGNVEDFVRELGRRWKEV